MRFYLILILIFISKTSIADDVLLNDDFKLTNSEDNAVYRHAKGNFVNNKRDGKWQYQDQYTSDKNVWFGTYNKGKKIGLWLSKSEAGYITAREQYDESGKEKGTFYTFTADGLLKSKESYLDGQRHGESILYVSGEPISITIYDNGREIDTE